MQKAWFRVGCALLGLLSHPVFAVAPLAEGSSGGKRPFFLEKQETKEKHRWSLSDWLDTRDRMRVQDLWLALHSPSPYEFYLGASYRLGRLQTGASNPGWNVTFAGYAYLFGAEVQYETSQIEPRWTALANFRLFGLYNQATNFTFQFGAKQETRAGTSLLNWVGGAHLTVYLAKPAGFVLLYRHAWGRPGGVVNEVDRFEAGGFIDFKLLRLHVDYVVDTVASDPGRSLQGFQLGARLYF
jgi:hypothetical protein